MVNAEVNIPAFRPVYSLAEVRCWYTRMDTVYKIWAFKDGDGSCYGRLVYDTCGLLGGYRFGRTSSLTMEVVFCSEMLVPTHQNIGCSNPQACSMNANYMICQNALRAKLLCFRKLSVKCRNALLCKSNLLSIYDQNHRPEFAYACALRFIEPYMVLVFALRTSGIHRLQESVRFI
jgi:hypothetical protein